MRDRKGFTLIELLIVVVIIGILAAIAIPKFSATREKAYFAAMKSDLKNLASQQEIYYSDYYGYTDAVDSNHLGFVHTDNVTVAIANTSPTGWEANAIHTALPGLGCNIFYGDLTTAGGIGGADQSGVISCKTQ